MTAVPSSQRPLRHESALTGEGQELAACFGCYRRGGQVAGQTGGLHHVACGTPLEARRYCPTCGVLVEGEDASDLHRV